MVDSDQAYKVDRSRLFAKNPEKYHHLTPTDAKHDGEQVDDSVPEEAR